MATGNEIEKTEVHDIGGYSHLYRPPMLPMTLAYLYI